MRLFTCGCRGKELRKAAGPQHWQWRRDPWLGCQEPVSLGFLQGPLYQHHPERKTWGQGLVSGTPSSVPKAGWVSPCCPSPPLPFQNTFSHTNNLSSFSSVHGMGLGSGRSGPWARPLLLRPPLPGGDEWTKCQDERPLSLCGGLQGDDEEPTPSRLPGR